MTTHTEAARYAAAIEANVDAMCDGAITFEEFGANQRRLWDEIARDDTTPPQRAGPAARRPGRPEMTTHDYAERARMAAGMLIETAIRRAYHQLAAALGELHGATADDAKEIVEELLLSDG